MDGLFQEKWYSHESLKTSPFGYWMWRADWKLKQLAQGALYDDETKTSQPLEPGITVPEDYPDPCESQRVGRSRSWIVCRGITLRVIGENLVVIHPDDVQMGVEERRMVLNEAKNQFEDAVEQPSMASPEVTPGRIFRGFDRRKKNKALYIRVKKAMCFIYIYIYIMLTG